MNIKCARTFNSYSARRLRRARRLYAYLVFEACWEHGRPTIRGCARAAIERGLYKGPCIRSAAFSICRHMYWLYRKANPGQYDSSFGWYRFLDDNRQINYERD